MEILVIARSKDKLNQLNIENLVFDLFGIILKIK